MKKIAICLGLASSLLVSGVNAMQVARAHDGDLFKSWTEKGDVVYVADLDNTCGVNIATSRINVVAAPGVRVKIPKGEFVKAVTIAEAPSPMKRGETLTFGTNVR